jgi:hypothetical protein
LVWIAASRNVETADSWHDLAGYGIVVLVFIFSLGCAAWLGRKEGGIKKDKGESRATPFPIPNFYFLLCALTWLMLAEVAAVGWYRAHERNLKTAQHWNVHWPESDSGYHEIPIDAGVKSTLRFDRGGEVTWREHSNSTEGATTYLLFSFRWNPGASTILRARAHRPDGCLPNAGWEQIADEGISEFAAAPALSLPFRHFLFAREVPGKKVFAHIFFCIGEDAVRAQDRAAIALQHPTDWSPESRWRVVREGIRNPGQQVMELVMITPDQISSLEARDRFARVLPRLIKLDDKTTDH